jgi:poly-beta-1,6-N-acetyl-D-glucosamine synthase
MIPVTETVFWISLLIVFYTYAGYPLILLILVQMKRLFIKKNEPVIESYPPVSMVVAAYNEEDVLEAKIANSLNLSYPAEKLTLIFVTDGSDDRSQDILKKYPSVVHLHEGGRKGKLAAMNRAMDFVKTEYVIFSDANTQLNRDCVELIMRHYTDPKVGAVAGEKKIISAETGVAGTGRGYVLEV